MNLALSDEEVLEIMQVVKLENFDKATANFIENFI